MAELINHTEVYCHACQTSHPARQVHDQGKIVGMVDCPEAPWQVTLSDHAAMYLRFREQAGFDPAFQPPERRTFFFNYLSITDDCNSRCPVCFAAAGSTGKNAYLSLPEVEEIAVTAKNNGVRGVVLFGGEPTLHPQLLDIVGVFKQRNLKVALATNGLLIAQQPTLATQLKSAGVYKICLQLDSFTDQVHHAIRGHGKIEEKLAAARAISDAGVILGVVCTVTSYNLPELSSFCRTLLAWPAPPQSIAFQAVAHSGRLTIDEQKFVTREDVVVSLADGEAIPGLATAHFWTFPVFRAFDIYVHPDCSANTVAVITSKGIKPLSAYLDLDKLIGLASRSPGAESMLGKTWNVLSLLVRCVRIKGVALLLQHMFERLTGRRGAVCTFIGTGAFLRPDFLDMYRIKRCASSELTAQGCESLCAFHGIRSGKVG